MCLPSYGLLHPLAPTPHSQGWKLAGGARRWRIIVFGLLILAGARTGPATAAPAVSASLWPQQVSDLPADPDVRYELLPNGLRVVMMPNREPRERVSLHLVIQAGSMQESDSQLGLAHFLEHMLFNGSRNFAPGELVKFFQEIGMDFGPDANAHTGFFETVYDILLPQGSEQRLRQGLTVLRDFADGALLLPEEIEREKKVVLAEMRDRDSVDYRTFVATLGFELPAARVSQRLPIGREETIKSLTAEALHAFYADWYRPETMIVVAVGDFDPALLARLVAELFGPLAARAPRLPQPEFGRIDHSGVRFFNHYEAEAGNASLGIETLQLAAPEPDTFARRRRELTQELANAIIQHRLDKAVRQPAAPFTSANIGSGHSFRNNVQYAEIAADSAPERWSEALSAIESTLRGALTHGFSSEELERVRKQMHTDLEQAVQRAATRDSSALARGLIRSLNEGRVFLSPQQRLELLSPMLAELTLDEVHAALRKAWSGDQRLVLLTGNADLRSIGDPMTLLSQTYAQSQARPVAPPSSGPGAAFPYLPQPTEAGQIAQRNRIEDLGIVQLQFANGVRLNLKQTDFKADEVAVSLALGYGRSVEPAEKPGLTRLALDVFNESGLGGMDRDSLEQALTGHTASVAVGAEEGRFVLRGRSGRKDQALLFQLLHAYLLDLGYRPEAYALVRERYEQRYSEMARTVEGAMDLAGETFLAGGDSRFGLPPRERFMALTLDDVRDWIAPIWSREPIELSVVGDLDVEAIIDLAARYFGSLPARSGPEGAKRSDRIRFPLGQRLELELPTRIPKGLVVVAYPTSDGRDVAQARRLSVLADVFSDRLRQTLREKLGAAYSPGAYHRASRVYPGYGVMRAEVEVNPAEAEAVADETRRIAATLARDGVSLDEMRRALNPTLTTLKSLRRNNGYWLATVLTGSSREPEQFEWSRSMLADFEAITAAELSTLARMYLEQERAAVILVRPADRIDTEKLNGVSKGTSRAGHHP